MRKRLVFIGSLVIAGVLSLGHGAYLFAKAQFAQFLLAFRKLLYSQLGHVREMRPRQFPAEQFQRGFRSFGV